MEQAQEKAALNALVKRVVLTSTAILIVMALAVVASRHPKEVVSLAAGTAVSIASFLVLVFTASRTMAASIRPLIVVIGFVKLGALGVLLWWLVSRELVHPMTFLAGFSAVVLALLVEGMRLKGKGDKR